MLWQFCPRVLKLRDVHWTIFSCFAISTSFPQSEPKSEPLDSIPEPRATLCAPFMVKQPLCDTQLRHKDGARERHGRRSQFWYDAPQSDLSPAPLYFQTKRFYEVTRTSGDNGKAILPPEVAGSACTDLSHRGGKRGTEEWAPDSSISARSRPRRPIDIEP